MSEQVEQAAERPTKTGWYNHQNSATPLFFDGSNFLDHPNADDPFPEHWLSRCWQGPLVFESVEIAARDAELARLRTAMSVQREEIEQILGKALGCPWFKDDQKNFPGATEANGVCVGDHVAETLAIEAAEELAELRSQLLGRLVSDDEARELQDILCTLTPSGTALKTSARELVAAFERWRTKSDLWMRAAREAQVERDELRRQLEQRESRVRELEGELGAAMAEIRGVKGFAGWDRDDPSPADSAAAEMFNSIEQLKYTQNKLTACVKINIGRAREWKQRATAAEQRAVEAERYKPKVIMGDGKKQLPLHHHIAENIPDKDCNLPYSNFVSMGELTIKGRIYLDYGKPEFPTTESEVSE